jgi:hypothetical protein
MTFKLKAYVGPCFVSQYAVMMRRAGLKVTCEGTEHVYVNGDGSSPGEASWNASVDWRKTHENDGPKFIPSEEWS